MQPITVLLADDHRMLTQALRTLLEQSGQVRVIGEARDGNEALAMAERHRPNVVVLDIAMPNLNGFDATRAIRQRCPQTRVVILTMYETEEYVSEALKAGATCYVSKEAAADELLDTIRAAARGAVFLQPTAAAGAMERVLKPRPEGESPSELTPREVEILHLIGQGRTNRAIAAELSLSHHTVRAHRSNIMRKLDAHNTAELIGHAVEKGFIHPQIR